MQTRRNWIKTTAFLAVATIDPAAMARTARGDEDEGDGVAPVDIGCRRELFIDQYLIERLEGVRLALHRPSRREIVFRTDAPWEGNDVFSFQFPRA